MFMANQKSSRDFLSLLKITTCLICFTVLAACSSVVKMEVSITPTPSVQIATAPYLTETAVPACVSNPDIKLEVLPISDNAVQIVMNGLQPYEPVYVIFSSAAQGQTRKVECCAGAMADANGSYQQTQTLRGQNVDVEFKHWQVQVVHSQGSACAEFNLP